MAESSPSTAPKLLNLSKLMNSLNGDVSLKLKLAANSGTVEFPRLPEGVSLNYNETTGLITLSGDADAIRLVLAELAFSPLNSQLSIFDVQVEITHGQETHQLNLSLSFQTDSNHYVPLSQTTSSGYSPQPYEPIHIAEPTQHEFLITQQIAIGSVHMRGLTFGEEMLSDQSEIGFSSRRSFQDSPQTFFNSDEDILFNQGANQVVPEEKPSVTPLPEPPVNTALPEPAPPPPLPEPPLAPPPTVSGGGGGSGNPPLLYLEKKPVGGETYDEDTLLEMTDFHVETPASTVTAVLTLSDANAGSFNEPSSGTATSTFDPVAGTLTINGDKSDVNAVIAQLEFTPSVNYSADFTIDVQLSDDDGNTATDSLAMNGNPADDPLTLDNAIPDQTADTGTAFSFTPAANTFGNPDSGDVLTYSAELSDGSPLPVWLVINPSTGELSGTPPASAIGTLSIKVIVNDGVGNLIDDTFDLVIGSSLNVIESNQTDNYTEDTAYDPADIIISTSESTVTITLTLSDQAAGTFNTATAGSVTSTFDAATGVWQASGNVANVNTLLAGLQYTPAADYDQDLTINVSVDDGFNPVKTGTIDLTVNAVNDSPVLDTPQVDKIIAATNSYTLDISGNFSDPDTVETLTYTAELSDSSPLPGWLTLDANTGIFSGTPGVGDIATLDIVVTVTDALGETASDSYTLDVSAGGLIIGTPNDDDILGTNSDNEIYGRAGNDTISGLNGNDTLYGEGEDDFIDGGHGRDSIEGGTGNDTLIGGHPTSSSDHHDTLLGGDGNDYLDGGYRNDSLYGGNDHDTLFGGVNDDRLYAGDGINFLSGGGNNDQLHGETGSTNQFFGGAGRDLLYGGTGQDIFGFRDVSDSTGSNRDTIYNFTQGQDKIDLSAFGFAGIGDLTLTPGTTTRIDNGSLRIDLSGNYTLTAADFIFATTAADIAVSDQILQTGNAWNMPLTAGTFASIDDGNVTYSIFTLSGDAFDWWLVLDPTNGTLSGTPQTSDAGQYDVILRATNGSGEIAQSEFTITIADNVILGTVNADSLPGTANADAIYGLGNDDSISGGAGDDVITALGGTDTILGGDGNDTITAGDGDDSIDGGIGADLIYAGSGNDTVTAGPDNTNNDGHDTVYGGDGNDVIFGGRRNDQLYGEAGNDYLDEEINNDTLYGGDGNDTLIGGNNDDRLYAGDGKDILFGGNNRDYLYGDTGLNMMDGGVDIDYLYGGSGLDIYVFSDLSHSTQDRIYNFDQGTDKIDLSALGFAGIGDLTIVQGATTTIDDPNSSFHINVMSNLTLTAADFIFAANAADGDILDQAHEADSLFNVSFGGGHFASIDDGDLYYTATLSNGNPLPTWLTLDNTGLTLSGTPTSSDIGLYDITIRATNGSGVIAEDQFNLSVGENVITGTINADTLTGTADADVMIGLDDTDSISGAAGADLIHGNDGNDTIAAGNDRDTVYGGDGNDSIDGGYERDTLYGGDGNDTIMGSVANNSSDREDRLYGENGNDYTAMTISMAAITTIRSMAAAATTRYSATPIMIISMRATVRTFYSAETATTGFTARRVLT